MLSLRVVPLFLLGAAASARAQTPTNHHAGHAIVAEAPAAVPAVPIYGDLGHYGRRVSTTSVDAQHYFDQGIRLTYGFGLPEARRAFREAARLDSTCAMC